MTNSSFLRWGLLVLLAATLCSACGSDPVTGKRKLLLISRDQEIAMGTESAPQFETQFGGLVPDPRLQQYVNSIGTRIATNSHRPDMPYEFAVLASDVPNAFALPGGKIYITAGLLQRLTNERQLVGVLGHEIGHVAAQHSVEQLQKSMGIEMLLKVAGAVLGDSGEAVQAGGKIAANMVVLKYSRNDEYEADALGIEYLARAGYNPWGMVEVLELLQSLSESDGGAMTEMFQTHPLPKNRIEKANDLVQTQYPTARKNEPDANQTIFLGIRNRLVQR